MPVRDDKGNRRHGRHLLTAFVAAFLAAALVNSASGQHAPPARAIASDFQMSGNPLLPGRCALSLLAPRIAAALGAFNAGRGAAFANAFVPGRLDFEPYNGHPAGPYRARSRATVASLVPSRHRAGDGWTAFQLGAPPTATGSGIFGLSLRVRAGNVAFEQGVKLVVWCRTGQIRTWRGPAWPRAQR